MTRKIVSWFLILTLVFFKMSIGTQVGLAQSCDEEDGDFCVGNGEDIPFEIRYAKQLDNVRGDYLNKNFILMEDINLSDFNANGGWVPIGSDDARFTGTFDGNEKEITGLTIIRADAYDQGLFGVTGASALIKNVLLVNVDVFGNGSVGGLVGWNRGGTIQDSSVTGEVLGFNWVGGLVGENENGTIKGSFVSADVTGWQQYVGGLVGLSGGHIIDSHSDSIVEGLAKVGGLIGLNSSDIINSHSEGEVVGIIEVGGLVGHNDGNISDSSFKGDVEGHREVGGLIGQNNGGTITDSSVSAFVIGVDKEAQNSYWAGGLIGWSSGDISNSTFEGEVEGQGVVGGLVGENFEGTITDSSVSATVKGIQWIGGLAGSNQGDIIDSHSKGTVSGINEVGGLVGWSNSDISDSSFEGDVEGHREVGGLVGENDGGTIIGSSVSANVTGVDLELQISRWIGGLVGSNKGDIIDSHSIGSISGKNEVGGLVGWHDYNKVYYDETGKVKKIFQSWSESAVSGNEWIGGLVGWNEFGLIQSSHAEGNVTGHKWIGGLVGGSTGEIIETFYSVGSVSGTGDYVGGLVGQNGYVYAEETNNQWEGTIKNSFVHANVTGNNIVGGLVGANIKVSRNDVEYFSEISNSFATGSVIGEQSEVGGLVGKNDGNVSNSYYNKETTGQNDTGKGEGKTTAEMKQQATYVSWNFSEVWGINRNVNEGYPFLRWEGYTHTPYILEINANPSNCGIVTGTGTYDEGDLVQLTATPNSGYRFVDWTLGEKVKSSDSNFMYTMTSQDTVLVANFTTTTTGGGSGSGATTSTIKEINPSTGGVVSSGGVQIVFSPDVFGGTINVIVEKVDNLKEEWKPQDKKLVSDIFEITKDKEGNFDKPVTITLPFNLGNIDKNQFTVAVHWLNEETGEWIELDNIKVDWNTGKVSGDVDHFTKFTVLATEKPSVNLTDIRSHWGESNIINLVGVGAISGYPDGTFKPNNQITRAEFTAIVVRVLGLDITGNKVFADTSSHWAKDMIATAYEQSIIQGYNEDTFGADDPITREQMAAIIVNAFELQQGEGKSFADQKQISSWAKDAIQKASSNGIITGYEDGTFKPKNNATRAEAATVIVRALEK